MAKIKKSKKVLYWSPRILAIIFILFISLFALDVFGEYNFPLVLVALFMHLIPTFILIIILVVAWKVEDIGGILFLILGVGFTVFFNTYRNIVSFSLITLPPLIIGLLFLLNKYINKKKPKKKK